MKSIDQMLQRLSGLLGTDDLTDWEQEFLSSVIARVHANHGDTTRLSERQVDVVERLFNKHFAG